MKTAVSIPDDVFERAEELARRLNTSRSALYARALAEFIVHHDTDQVTERMDRALDDIGVPDTAFATAAARRTMRESEW